MSIKSKALTVSFGGTSLAGSQVSSATSVPFFPVLPKRYEHTRAAILQDFTHSRIVDAGQGLHENELRKLDLAKAEAIKAAEQNVQAEAMRQQEIALDRLRQTMAREHEKSLRRAAREYEKQLKEHGLSVEAALQKEMTSRVQQERDSAAEALKKAIKECEVKCEKEKNEAVKAARREVNQEAKREMDALAAKLKQTLDETKEKMVETMNKKLKELKLEAIERTKEMLSEQKRNEEEKQAKALEKAKEERQAAEKELLKRIDEVKLQLRQSERDVEEAEEETRKWQQKLLDKQKAFEAFVDSCGLFNKGNSDFLVPPLNPLDN